MKKQKGFTFLELMIAMFLLTVGILGASKLLRDISRASHKSFNQIVAAYLAQEGIELVRNMRDNNWLDENSGAGWIGNNKCYEMSILKNQEKEVSCQNNYSNLRNLYLSEVNIGGQSNRIFYNYNVGRITPYKRKIEFKNIESNKSVEIIATVYWSNKDDDKIIIKTMLYNWR